MVVVGDADFLANAFYNRSSDAFFLNSVNWLRGRLDLIGIPPKEKKKLVLEADASPWRMALRPIGYIVTVLFVMGVTVWIVRHRF